jgi:hypothetical protein
MPLSDSLTATASTLPRARGWHVLWRSWSASAVASQLLSDFPQDNPRGVCSKGTASFPGSRSLSSPPPSRFPKGAVNNVSTLDAPARPTRSTSALSPAEGCSRIFPGEYYPVKRKQGLELSGMNSHLLRVSKHGNNHLKSISGKPFTGQKRCGTGERSWCYRSGSAYDAQARDPNRKFQFEMVKQV